MNPLAQINRCKNVVVIGAQGSIGRAFIEELRGLDGIEKIFAISRTPIDINDDKVIALSMDYENEASLVQTAAHVAKHGPVQLTIVTTGILHQDGISPEKSLNDLSFDKFERLFRVNTIVPAMIAKYFLKNLPKKEPAYFAVLSARVGSISDNYLGGWYAYRASKAALNMIVRTAAIETRRRFPHAMVVGLHPGTVDSPLSKPFQRNVKPEKLFSPSYSVQKLLETLNGLTPDQTGRCFAWDGCEIDP